MSRDEFEEIVSDYNGSDLYAAVVRAEQEHPDALPVIIGLHAWTMLDNKQKQEPETLQSLLQAFVTVVQAERTEGSRQALVDAMEDFNAKECTDFRVATKSIWLGYDGPTYLIGDVRAKALFEDTRGRHWADGALVAESLALAAGNHALIEAYSQALCGPDEVHDMWTFTDTRGQWNALMAPVEVIAESFGYPPPVRLADGDWGRTWWDMPTLSDAQELCWIASGGKPLRSYRTGARP